MPTQAAGIIARQGNCTLRPYCQVDMAVPQTEALLLVPSSVAGGAVGKVANSAGSKMRPPPPTMASTKPASIEASETMIHSIGRRLSHRPGAAAGWPQARSEEHTSELQSQSNLVCRLLLEKKKKNK